MNMIKYIKLLGLILGIVAVNVLAFSPGFIGLNFGEGAFTTALSVTLLFGSAMALLYGSYTLLLRQPIVLPVKHIETHEDYVEALSFYRRIKVLEEDITLGLSQLSRMKKKKETLLNVLHQRFDPGELSYKKFASVTLEVEKLLYLNIRSVLNRLNVFDEADYANMMKSKSSNLPQKLFQEKTKVYNDYLSYVKNALHTNEEILLKLDQLLLEISRLDSFEAGDIEQMPCMQEIDQLIKHTKLYRQ
ncbi:hypothetical protein IFU39_11310 [Paenibacillus sp. CFBP 13594]|nr:hypothetical protein [Paenibacillus sp. CFBP 13594]MBD8838403.1 hypothetical protein [Paenibacillus sp. CFBP 13594]QZN77988.1 hypothetical protein K5K90_12815 [Paenibacillus sp. DR312]